MNTYGTVEDQTFLHIMDDHQWIASYRTGTDFGDGTPSVVYYLNDHLGSNAIMLDEDNGWISHEEYYPFGETSFGAFSKKRYRFCGKERDEESGLYYYGARYYAPWICRFVSVDALAHETPFFSPYAYADDNPVMNNDPTGNGTEKADGGNKGSSGNNISNNNASSSGGTGASEKKGSKILEERVITGSKNVIVLYADEKDIAPKEHGYGLADDSNKNWSYVVVKDFNDGVAPFFRRLFLVRFTYQNKI